MHIKKCMLFGYLILIICFACSHPLFCNVNTTDKPLVSTINKEPFDRLSEIAVDHNGDIFVAIHGRHDIVYKLSPDGSSKSKIPAGGYATVDSSGSPTNELRPASEMELLAIDPTGNLIVVDGFGLVLSKITFSFLSSNVTNILGGIDGDTLVEGEINNPTALAVGKDGAIYLADTVYTSDTETYRIRKIKDNKISLLAGTATDLKNSPETSKPNTHQDVIDLRPPEMPIFKLNRVFGMAVDQNNNGNRSRGWQQ